MSHERLGLTTDPNKAPGAAKLVYQLIDDFRKRGAQIPDDFIVQARALWEDSSVVQHVEGIRNSKDRVGLFYLMAGTERGLEIGEEVLLQLSTEGFRGFVKGSSRWDRFKAKIRGEVMLHGSVFIFHESIRIRYPNLIPR